MTFVTAVGKNARDPSGIAATGKRLLAANEEADMAVVIAAALDAAVAVATSLASSEASAVVLAEIVGNATTCSVVCAITCAGGVGTGAGSDSVPGGTTTLAVNVFSSVTEDVSETGAGTRGCIYAINSIIMLTFCTL